MMHCYICGWELDPDEIDEGLCMVCKDAAECEAAQEAYEEAYLARRNKTANIRNNDIYPDPVRYR